MRKLLVYSVREAKHAIGLGKRSHEQLPTADTDGRSKASDAPCPTAKVPRLARSTDNTYTGNSKWNDKLPQVRLHYAPQVLADVTSCRCGGMTYYNRHPLRLPRMF